jgi:ribosomal protein L11 methyltransferase
MFSLDLDCAQEAGQETKDLLIAELWDEGSCGIVELDAARLRAFFDDDAEAPRLSEKFGGAPAASGDTDWISMSRSNIEPVAVGAKFFLVPEWRDDPAPQGRFRIEINNGLAFGTGRHETTRLCLELLEKYVAPGMTVLDVGTGSGILARAAKLLGAGLVAGCDIDPLAVEVAAAHVAAFIGSAAAVRDGVADLVVANISPECLREMASEWTRLLKPGGHAILSGVELHDGLPFNPIETRTEGQWKALVIQKPSHT